MRKINLINKDVLSLLDSYIDNVKVFQEKGLFQDESDLQHYGRDHPIDTKGISNAYMHHIIQKGEAHEGFPDAARMWRYGSTLDDQNAAKKILTNETVIDFRRESKNIVDEITSTLGARHNALMAHYPPDGYIGWHNNANAHGYNIILTWSETGEGWFDYFDLETQGRIRMPDQKGWTAKMGYFGGWHNPDKLFYHAAATDCMRVTLSFVFNEDDDWWEDAIEEMETP